MNSVRRGRKGGWLETHLFRSDRSLACLPEFLDHTWVAPKVLLASNKDDRQTSTEMHNFGNPLKKNGSDLHYKDWKSRGTKMKENIILSPGRYQASLESRLRNK